MFLRRVTHALVLVAGLAAVAPAISHGLAVGAAPQGTASADPASGEAAVRAAEARRFKALAEGDIQALRNLLADDFTYTHSTGLLQDRDAYLAPLISGATRYQTAEGSELKIRVYGDAAVVNGRAKLIALVNGEVHPNDLRYTNVWIRRRGVWQLVAWHSSKIK